MHALQSTGAWQQGMTKKIVRPTNLTQVGNSPGSWLSMTSGSMPRNEWATAASLEKELPPLWRGLVRGGSSQKAYSNRHAEARKASSTPRERPKGSCVRRRESRRRRVRALKMLLTRPDLLQSYVESSFQHAIPHRGGLPGRYESCHGRRLHYH